MIEEEGKQISAVPGFIPKLLDYPQNSAIFKILDRCPARMVKPAPLMSKAGSIMPGFSMPLVKFN